MPARWRPSGARAKTSPLNMPLSQSFAKLCRFSLAAAAALALSMSAQARVVTDDNGDTMEVPDKIERLVVANVLPLASAATVYLQDGSRVAGMHPASMSAAKSGLLGELFPEVLKADTRFIQGASLNIESLMKLKPDVVLVNAPDRRMIEQIRSAGLTAFAVSPTKWRYDVLKTYDGWMASLAELFPDAPTNAQVVRDESQRIAKLVGERTADIAPEARRRVLFIVRLDGKSIVTSGRNFFGQYWCDAIGAVNAASEVKAQNQNAVVSMEDVYAWDPDLIFITNFTPAMPADLIENRDPGRDWSTVSAVEKGAVFKMPLGVYRTYTPSADTPLTLLWMAKTAYPSRFADIDLDAEVKAYYKRLFNASLTDEQVRRMFDAHASAAQNASTNVRSGK